MAIKQFYIAEDNKVNDNREIIIWKIVKTYNIRDETYETNKKDIIISKVGYSDKINAFWKLWLYKEIYKNENNKQISYIN